MPSGLAMGGVHAGSVAGHWGDQDESKLSLTSSDNTADLSTERVAKVLGSNCACPEQLTSSPFALSAIATALRQTPASRVTTWKMPPVPPSGGWPGSISTRTEGPAES